MSVVALTFYKGFGKKRCVVAIFPLFLTVFSIDFIGVSVVIELIIDYSNYNIMIRAETISSVQFYADKQDYDFNFFGSLTYSLKNWMKMKLNLRGWANNLISTWGHHGHDIRHCLQFFLFCWNVTLQLLNKMSLRNMIFTKIQNGDLTRVGMRSHADPLINVWPRLQNPGSLTWFSKPHHT